jgi:hypothetical protein
LKPKPKAKREGKKHDSGKKLVAAIQGNHGPFPTAFAELLTGFVQLGMRLPKAADLPFAAKTHSFEIQRATDIELPNRIEALARDLAAVLQRVNTEDLPDLLRKTSAVIASRPLKRHPEGTGHMVLKPADPVTVAAHLAAWRHAVKKLPSQRIITKAEMTEHLEAMPPENRDKEMEKLSAGNTTDAEGRTRRRKLTQLFPELRLTPGRPRKSDK